MRCASAAAEPWPLACTTMVYLADYAMLLCRTLLFLEEHLYQFRNAGDTYAVYRQANRERSCVYPMTEPIIVPDSARRASDQQPIAAIGQSFDLYEWSGSGPDYLHVHYADDEAWHILEGTLTFRFRDRHIEAPAGTTVFVPAGVPHTYFEAAGATRYLIILTPRLRDLIAALHAAPREQHDLIMSQFESAIVE